MGNISGHLYATCKVCTSIFSCHVDSMPFPDSEFIGTCRECILQEEHDIVDESYKPMKIIGKIYFRKHNKEVVAIVSYIDEVAKEKGFKNKIVPL